MKKTVSINISGVIFHIEEDGYEKLKNYLSSIQQYFSTYEDSQEIVTDIENRIAEKLLAKLKTAEKQVVSLEDINELVGAMGTVADFEAVEEEEILVNTSSRQSAAGSSAFAGSSGTASASGQTTSAPGQPYPAQPQPRRIFRDLRRKTLGGVAAGIANYFNIDPVWVRLAFVTLVVGLPALVGASGGHNDEFFGGLSGFTVLAYIAMWIAFPGSMVLEEDKSVKKFYRNPDDKVLGGVASGIAVYFGVDTGLVRLIFVVSIVFFGVGLLAYLVLWIIAPTANTLTEKMEMQGQPITLTNIEQSIKTNLNLTDTAGRESAVGTVLLFPFRLIASVFNGLGRALGPLLGGVVAMIRVLVGITILLVGFALMIACLAVAGVALGLSNTAYGDGANFPIELIRSDLSPALVLSALVAGLLPALGLAVLGLLLITKRSLVNSRTAVTLLGVWFISLLILGATVPAVITRFRKSGSVEVTKTLTVAGTPTFDLNDIDADYEEHPRLELSGYEGSPLKLVETRKAQGRNRADAEANARLIDYKYTRKDSTITFENGIELGKKARFRMQHLELNLAIPYEKPFRMTNRFARYIRNEFSETELDRMDRSIWKFTRTSGTASRELVCINFPRDLNTADNDDDDDDEHTEESAGGVTMNFDEEVSGDMTRQFTAANFSSVDASGAFIVRILPGSTYKVVAKGNEKDIDDLNVTVRNGVLKVYVDHTGLLDWTDRDRIGLTITMPTIENLDLSGASKGALAGFGPLKNVGLHLSGACEASLDASITNLTLDFSGASKAELKGRADRLKADLSGACKLEATALTVNRAEVQASGASTAELGVVRSLSSETSGASKVTRQSGDEQ